MEGRCFHSSMEGRCSRTSPEKSRKAFLSAIVYRPHLIVPESLSVCLLRPLGDTVSLGMFVASVSVRFRMRLRYFN